MKAVFFINDVAMALGFRACNEIFAFFRVVCAAGAQMSVYENTSRVFYGSLPLTRRPLTPHQEGARFNVAGCGCSRGAVVYASDANVN